MPIAIKCIRFLECGGAMYNIEDNNAFENHFRESQKKGCGWCDYLVEVATFTYP